MRFVRYFAFAILTFMFDNGLKAQDKLPKENITFFLDCDDCDFNFVRQELDFIAFVRDPKLADVHILSSDSDLGGGGNKYFLNFIGMDLLEGKNLELEYFSEQSETDDETRKGLLKLIKSGVLYYYAESGLLGGIDIGLELNSTKKVLQPTNDPWKLWVFRIEAGGNFEKEKSQNEYSYETEVRIEKVTPEWKIRLEGSYQSNHENYFDDYEKITDQQRETEIDAYYIKSLSPRWSAGTFCNYSSITYLNIMSLYQASAGIEYNVFPWDVSNRKIFTFRYEAGARNYKYNKTTIYDKTAETLFFEELSLNLELVQPWGTIETHLEGRHYFHDFTKNRFTLYSQLSIRLTKQFSVYCELGAEVVHDQLYLPKGEATLEDILLERRKMATTYELGGQIGFRFTFGSIYNNVVNERF